MSGRKWTLGLCALCSLLASGFMAQSASATGTWNYTCRPTSGGGAGFSAAHCKPADAVLFGATFVHELFPINSSGEWILTGANTTETVPTFLSGSHAGVALELKATGVSGTGSMTNSGTEAAKVASGTGTITYTGVTVTKPSGKGCKVPGEKIVTKTLKASTASLTQELKFEPNEGKVFAEFKIEACSVAELNTTYKVEGSVKGQASGATTTFTESTVTTENTLTLGGLKAGIAGTLTVSGRRVGESAFTPLSLT